MIVNIEGEENDVIWLDQENRVCWRSRILQSSEGERGEKWREKGREKESEIPKKEASERETKKEK